MPQDGDIRWEVEWCSKLVFYAHTNPDGSKDVDRDSCSMRYNSFGTWKEAKRCAERVYDEAARETFGIVTVTEYRYTVDPEDRLLSDWQPVGDESYIFSGEWESEPKS
jgi:hypothetical protein